MLAAGAAFTILPAATLYTRQWKIEPAFDPSLYMGEWQYCDVLYERVFKTSPWVRMIKSGKFPEGMENTISELTYERSERTIGEKLWTSLDYEAH